MIQSLIYTITLPMKVKIPHSLVHISVFMLLCFLYYEAHHLTRHVIGAALCGSLGTMAFTVTITRVPCSFPTLVVLSGLLLTCGLAWLGVFLLRSTKYRLFASALIFAGQWFRFSSRVVAAWEYIPVWPQWRSGPAPDLPVHSAIRAGCRHGGGHGVHPLGPAQAYPGQRAGEAIMHTNICRGRAV